MPTARCQDDWINSLLPIVLYSYIQYWCHILTLTLGDRGGSWLAFARGYTSLLDKPLEELCPGDRNTLGKKKELIRISSLKNEQKIRPNRETLTYLGDMALVSHQGHSIHPLGKHGTSLHGCVACRSQQDMVLDFWIQEDKSDQADRELLRVHQWVLGSVPYWHSNTCNSKYRNTLVVSRGYGPPLVEHLSFQSTQMCSLSYLPWAAGSCGGRLSRAVAIVPTRARLAVLQTPPAFAVRPGARRAL